MSDNQPPVLIVGSGPSGLIAAITLLKNSVPVRIIEKALNFHEGSRGPGIQPRSLEVFQNLRVLDDVMRAASHFPMMKLYKGPENVEALKTFHRVEITEPTPTTPWPITYGIGQNRLEEILRQKLAESGVHVELGMELVGIDQDKDGVTARIRKSASSGPPEEIEIRTSYLIGADGAKGVTRKLMNLGFKGETKDSEGLIVGDVEIPDFDTEWWNLWLVGEGGEDEKKTILIRPLDPHGPGKKFNFIIGGGDLDISKYNSTSDAENLFYELTTRRDIKFTNWTWFSHFRPNMRMVDKFSEGRVFVGGDAAHVHSPTGGQGLNSGVQDMYNLAWKLSLVYKGISPHSLLNSYTSERQPVIAELLRRTSSLHAKTLSSKADQTVADQNSGFFRTKALFMLGINYRWSDLLVDERSTFDRVEEEEELKRWAYGGDESRGNGLVCAGDRAPDAPLVFATSPHSNEETSLFKHFDPSKHTVLIFTPDDISEDSSIRETISTLSAYPTGTIQTLLISPTGKAQIDNVDISLADRDGHAANAYLAPNGEKVIIVVRPDMYIGAIAHGSEGIKKYLSNIFV